MDLIKGIKELIYIDNIVPINKETGEIIEDGYVIFTTKQLAEYKKKKEEEKKIRKNNSSFSWISYKTGNPILDKKLSGANLTRFIYLSTFIKYGEDILIQSNNKSVIKKDDLPKILGIKKRSVQYFLKECKEKQLLTLDKNNIIHINTNYIFRGEVSLTNNTRFSKLYHKKIREIYEKVDIESHKNLSYLFLILPYINIEWNIICKNPYETNPDLIECMSLEELSNILEYDKSHIARLRNDLWRIRFNNGLLAINFFPHPEINKWKVIINPSLYYSGKQYDKTMDITKFMFPGRIGYTA